MPNRRAHDHIGNFNFKVEIEGVTQGAFAEVSGLDSETEVVEYQDGDDIILRKRPGRTRYSNIVLTRGYTHSDELWNWRKTVLDGQTERKPGAVVLMDEAQQPVLRWNFEEGWPSKWEGPSLNAKNSEVSVETMEITVEQVVLEPAG